MKEFECTAPFDVDDDGEDFDLENPNFRSSDINGIPTKIRDRIWPSRQIPYKIDMGFSDDQIQKIKAAMDDINKRTCVRFNPKKLKKIILELL